jgi:hypothetical protein
VDTRTKILDAQAARAAAARERSKGRRIILVSGRFDPLLAEHARALDSVASRGVVFACLSTPPEPLLSPGARAELTAALRSVSYVVNASRAEVETAIEPDEIVQREDEDDRLARELIRHVHQRQSAK